MEVSTDVSSMRALIITSLFVFSTIYTLGTYYYAARGVSFSMEGLEDRDSAAPLYTADNTSWLTTIVAGSLDFILDAVSWISPFALVKGVILYVAPAKLYDVLNLLFLRPVGWIASWITTEWVINKIRGVSS